MKRSKRLIMFLLLAIIMLSIPTVVVFAKELGLLTISGPGIKSELALKDQKVITTLEASGFFDQTGLVQPPKNLNMEAGYAITAYLNLDGQVLPYVQMVYYAADQGQPGYVHFTGRLAGATLQPVDQWQRLTRNADHTFRGLMSVNDLTLQPALITVPAAAPAIDPAVVAAPPIRASHIIVATVAMLLLLAGTGIILRRRAVSHTTM
jgi:hypothetical protein